MELSKFENGIDMHNHRIKNAIKYSDLYVMHEDGYSYTVGMRDIGAPELVLYGQRKVIADELFKIIYIAAAREAGVPDIDAILNKVLEPAPKLVSLSKDEKMALFYAARTFYDDWSFDVFKLTITDEMSEH